MSITLKLTDAVLVKGENLMQKFNLHTHTFRCGHASGTDDQMVLSAIEAGF